MKQLMGLISKKDFQILHASSQTSFATTLLGSPSEAAVRRHVGTRKGLREVGWDSSTFALVTEKSDI